jgi:hypothetical protein
MPKSTNQCLPLLPSVNVLIQVPNFNAPTLTALIQEAVTLLTTVSRSAVVSVVTILLGGVAHRTSICTPDKQSADTNSCSMGTKRGSAHVASINHTDDTPSHSHPDQNSTTDCASTVSANLSTDILALNTTGATYWCSATAFSASTPKSNINHFFHDNGATKSIFNDHALFRTYNHFDTAVNVNSFDSGLLAPAPARGIVHLESIINGQKLILDISDALHIPTAHVNLISGSALDLKGVSTLTHNGKIELSKNGQVITQGSLWKGLYHLNLTPVQQNTPGTITSHSLLSHIEPVPFIQHLSSMPMSTALQAMNTTSDKADFYTT